MRSARVALIWVVLAGVLGVPIALSLTSPLLEWRGPVYILAGLAGMIALGLTLVQPLLIAGYFPGLAGYRGRRVHHWGGGALVDRPLGLPWLAGEEMRAVAGGDG